jgi:3-deoxy-manno-octulosonate cytidylyltransferase (CMP-KDO synthetase)
VTGPSGKPDARRNHRDPGTPRLDTPPGKPFADLHGAPMIVHVLRRAEAAGIGEVVVATDLRRSQQQWKSRRSCGYDAQRPCLRVGPRLRSIEALDPEHNVDIVVNVQGDLPTISPADIRAALKPSPMRKSTSPLLRLSSPSLPSERIQTSSRFRARGSHPAAFK